MGKLIKTRVKYAIVGGDYSQQEPRLMTHLCGDLNLIDTYNNKRDLYATIGAMIFKKDYWECMEHWEDGSPNPTGKNIRKKCKNIVLGISYGMGVKRLSNILKVPIEECRDILNEFYKMFPAVEEFTKANEKAAVEIGYVEDYFGRRRHLPDAQLPELEFKAKDTVFTQADVFFECDDSRLDIYDKTLSAEWEKKWEALLSGNHRRKPLFELKADFKKIAQENNVEVIDNGGFIAKTITQCTNARIQGSAATLTKKAMVSIYNDKKLRDLGFRLLVPVHDELLGECPEHNRTEVEKRLAELMIEAAKPECSVDMKVDTYVVNHWYADDISDQVYESYNKLLEDKEPREAFNEIKKCYQNFKEETLREMCTNTFDTLKEDL